MTVDEALAIAETVLDEDESLNDVQELIFRQCWEGRQSYEEIAQISRYDDEYIKAAAAKLWKLLSEAFGEKVKKGNLQSVIKRYARRNHLTLHRTQVIGVNLSGANLSGANLLLFANLSETDSGQVELNGAVISDNNTKSSRKIIHDREEPKQEEHSNSEEGSLYWNGWRFGSEAEVKIAEALDGAGVLFLPNSRARMTTTEGKQNQNFNFLIGCEGKWGILEVERERSPVDAAQSEEHVSEITSQDIGVFQSYGIRIVQHYDATQCSEQPDRIVQKFLEILSQA